MTIYDSSVWGLRVQFGFWKPKLRYYNSAYMFSNFLDLCVLMNDKWSVFCQSESWIQSSNYRTQETLKSPRILPRMKLVRHLMEHQRRDHREGASASLN